MSEHDTREIDLFEESERGPGQGKFIGTCRIPHFGKLPEIVLIGSKAFVGRAAISVRMNPIFTDAYTLVVDNTDAFTPASAVTTEVYDETETVGLNAMGIGGDGTD